MRQFEGYSPACAIARTARAAASKSPNRTGRRARNRGPGLHP